MSISLTELGYILRLDFINTITVSLLALYVGRLIKTKSKLFDSVGLPAAVTGGLIFAFVNFILRTLNILTIEYDTSLQNPFMMISFICIGLSVSVHEFRKEGKRLFIFVALSIFMALSQNAIGIFLASIIGINPLLGLLSGSVSLSGGYALSSIFGKTVESMGVNGAHSIALSSATFGIVAGALLGSPLAVSIVKAKGLEAENVVEQKDIDVINKNHQFHITAQSLFVNLTLLFALMSLGMLVSILCKRYTRVILPSYIPAMICAIVFSNIKGKRKIINSYSGLIAIMKNTSISIFLSMASTSLKLWELDKLIVPIFFILVCQVTFMYFYTKHIVFKAMGSNYDAALMVSGMCGFGLGSMTNAMSNMGEVSSKYGYTLHPYLIVSITGAFIIEVFQIPMIVTAVTLLSK